jgi:ribosomal protein S18 acetylase RimI-like enzyme
MRVVEATAADCGEIGEVHLRSVRQAYRHIYAAAVLDSRSVTQSQAFWRELLARGEAQLFVARDEQQAPRRTQRAAGERSLVAGFTAFGASRDEGAAPHCGEIWAIYVAPERWGQGVGRALCSAAFARLRADGFSRVTLWVLAENERAIRFYRGVGFAPEPASARRFERDGAQIGELRMTRSLSEG